MIEYDPNAIVHPYITQYIREELPGTEGLLKSLELYAEKNSVPIVQPETAKLLLSLVYLKRPEHILEVGCAIGYSAMLMSEGLAEHGRITTVEYNRKMAGFARKQIEKAGLTDQITVVEADAKEYLPAIPGEGVYDMIFLDGPKAHYVYMLGDCVRLLKKGGLLVADNILYKGMTAEDSLVIRRKITIVKRLRAFIHELTHRRDLVTSVIPIGDGVTISVKK